MADDENESKLGNEKSQVKANASDSEVPADNEKESEKESDKVVGVSDTVKKEDTVPKKVEKNQKDDKIPKKETKSKKEEEAEDDDDDDDEDGETLPPGLLELPLEVEGKREKKKVERLSASMISSPQEKKKLEVEEGSGAKLGDIPYVENQLNITKVIDLKPLHRVLFLRIGTNIEIKRNIKQFSGFTHKKDSKEHEKRLACLNKMVLAELKVFCIILGLERGGTKGNLIDRVMDFLMEPEDKGLTVKTKSKKRSRSTGAKTKGTKQKSSKGTTKKGKPDKDSDNSAADDSDEDEEEEEEEEEEESEEEAPKKKKSKVEVKKQTPKKSAKENGKKEKSAPKNKTAQKNKTAPKNKTTPKNNKTKKTAAKKKPAPEQSDSISEDSDDEPISKMKKSPPSNDEIKDLVKKILDGADLETVTMKTVVKQVYAKYPSFDLSDRKDFIKDTVREVIL